MYRIYLPPRNRTLARPQEKIDNTLDFLLEVCIELQNEIKKLKEQLNGYSDSAHTEKQ